MERQGIQVPFTEICGDDKELLKEKIQQCLKNSGYCDHYRWCVCGEKDLLPEVLEELGAKKYFPCQHPAGNSDDRQCPGW